MNSHLVSDVHGDVSDLWAPPSSAMLNIVTSRCFATQQFCKIGVYGRWGFGRCVLELCFWKGHVAKSPPCRWTVQMESTSLWLLRGCSVLSKSPLHSFVWGFGNALCPSTWSRERTSRGCYLSLRSSLIVITACSTHFPCYDYAMYFEMKGTWLICIGTVYRTNPDPTVEAFKLNVKWIQGWRCVDCDAKGL